MKLAFIFGAQNFCNLDTDKFDFNNLYDDSRGLTGSELACIRVAEELAKKHDVHLFTYYKNEKPESWKGIKLHNIEELNTNFDAVCGINDPNSLDIFPDNVVRLVFYQINDFPFFKPGIGKYVDVWVSPSNSHLEMLKTLQNQPYT